MPNVCARIKNRGIHSVHHTIEVASSPGWKRERGIERSCMRQIFNTFLVNRNLHDTCPCTVACGTSDQRLNKGGLRYR